MRVDILRIDCEDDDTGVLEVQVHRGCVEITLWDINGDHSRTISVYLTDSEAAELHDFLEDMRDTQNSSN